MQGTGKTVPGEWRDVAHLSKTKLVVRGGLSILLGAIPVGVLYVCFLPDIIAGLFDLESLVTLVVTPLFVFWLAKDGIFRLRLAASGKCYLRAGPEGVWWRIGTYETRLSWSQIRKWYPHTLLYVLVPVTRQIRFEVETNTYSIDTYYFAEKQGQIARNITAAAHPLIR